MSILVHNKHSLQPPQCTHNNRCLSDFSKTKSLYQPISSMGYNHIASPQVARKQDKQKWRIVSPKEKVVQVNCLNQSSLPPDQQRMTLKPSKFIDHTCHNTPGYSTSRKDVIKIVTFDYFCEPSPEEPCRK